MIRVGITHGDINGIGYEVILKAFADPRLAEICIPVIYGSQKVATFHRKVMNLQAVNMNQIPDTRTAVANKVNIINCIDDKVKIELGEPSKEAGAAALAALERATDDLKKGYLDVLVTAPINKDNIQSEDFHFPGHTEYLEQKFANEGERSLMILAADELRVALVTGHTPLAEVPQQITKEKIIELAKVFNESLRRDFRIGKPKIAILSLNPHAGENGLLGSEENDVIIPAIQALQDQKMLCFGPFAADGFFGSGDFKRFDGVLAMYHDQGLAPFKAIAMEEGVNFTAGLPVVRTSPAHGTGYGIAGKNIASEESFRQAMYMAIDIFKNRKFDDEAYANPLQKLYVARGTDNEELDLSGNDND